MTLVRSFLILPLVAALWGPTAGNAQTGDVVKGKAVFMRCSICHSMAPGVKKLGPSLAGIMGRKAGSLPGFNYSPALKASGIVWTPKTLDAFLAKPQALVKGNKMAFPGLPAPADRANVIAYMKAPMK
jgi:cytochrome c